MAEYDDSLDPRDPEIEYAYEKWAVRDGYYGTGSTTPPKDHIGVISLVLVLFISCSSLISLLSLMNIQIFEEPEPTDKGAQVSFSVSAEGVLTAQLEEAPSVTTPPQQVQQPVLDAKLQISAVPGTMENIPGQTGVISWQAVYEKLIPSVVSITCHDGYGISSGTGVVMDSRGYIITNAHVVEDADQIRALLTDGRELEARCIGMDMVSDLAVLRVDATDLTPAEFGDSASLRVGDQVVAIGDPLGVELRGTMTDAIISGINRDVKTGSRTMTLIQTTAALNSGNSGGPLVNCYGQVIGINTMKIGDYASDYGVEGLGFAIPVTTVKTVVEQLASQGYVSGRPSLGLEGKSVSAFYQIYYHLPAGLMITRVESGSTAAQLGIQRGDILLSLNGARVTGADAMEEILYTCAVGDTLEAVFYTGGREVKCSLTVMEKQG